MPFIEPMLPKQPPRAGGSEIAPYEIVDVTLDRAAIYGANNWPELRSLASPVEEATGYTYTFTPDDNVSSVSGG